jgi:hypothetical protein
MGLSNLNSFYRGIITSLLSSAMPIQADLFLSFYVTMEADLSLLNEVTDTTTPLAPLKREYS